MTGIRAHGDADVSANSNADNNADSNAQAWCARLIVEELCRAGVEQAVLCPGMRNAPLLFALNNALGDQAISHLDERSAAFMALGIAKRTRKPCVICMTSGSAVANVLPALCEAYAAQVPLIILSADRPQNIHHSGAPQCMQQFNIFRDFVASNVQLPSSNPDADSMYICTVQIREAMEQCLGQCHLPIHINVPLSDPDFKKDSAWQRPNDPVITEISGQYRETCDTLPASFTDVFHKTQRVLAVAGPDCPLDPDDIIRFVEAANIPLIADACSGLRSSDSPNIIHYGDLLAAGKTLPTHLDALIRIGAAPIARSVYEYCAATECPVLRLDNRAISKDFLHQKFTCLVRPTPNCLNSLSQHFHNSDHHWLQSWQTPDRDISTQIQQWTDNTEWGEVTAAAEICRNHPFDFLQCSSSMSVRHANTFAQGRDVIAHRGVNGIDGSIGSFIGACLADNASGALLCGDLAFLHDLPALASARTLQNSACILVMNNNGGRIFDLLPVSHVPEHQKVITCEQNYAISSIAQAFHLNYHLVETIAALTQAMKEARASAGCSIIEVSVTGASLAEQWNSLKAHLDS